LILLKEIGKIIQMKEALDKIKELEDKILYLEECL